MQVGSSGLILSYVLSAASVHDIRVAEEVLAQHEYPVTFGDKGYLSQKEQEYLKQTYDIQLYTPSHSNSKTHRWTPFFLRWMRRKRKQIETTFSVLVTSFGLTSIGTTTLAGFETQIEGILLAYMLWKTTRVET